MKTKRTFVMTALSGIIVLLVASSAIAQNTYSQHLFTGLIYDLDLLLPGNTYGSYSGPSLNRFDNGRYPDRGRGYSDPYSSRYEEPYRRDEGRYYDRGRGDRDRRDRLEAKYEKAMRRLDRQEREALEKADRKYRGDRSHPGYRERLDKIQRKYAHKRDKVERNTANEYRKTTRRYDRRYTDDDDD